MSGVGEAPVVPESLEAKIAREMGQTSVGLIRAKLERFQECAEDPDSNGCDIGRQWFDTLTNFELLVRIQRSPALWEMTEAGGRFLELTKPAPVDGSKANNEAIAAAAPDMLAALQAVVRVADRATFEFDMARAAIAKALTTTPESNNGR